MPILRDKNTLKYYAWNDRTGEVRPIIIQEPLKDSVPIGVVQAIAEYMHSDKAITEVDVCK